MFTLFPLILQYFLDSKYELTSPRATHLAPDDEGGGPGRVAFGMNIGRMCLEWATGEITQRLGAQVTPPAPRLTGKMLIRHICNFALSKI